MGEERNVVFLLDNKAKIVEAFSCVGEDIEQVVYGRDRSEWKGKAWIFGVYDVHVPRAIQFCSKSKGSIRLVRKVISDGQVKLVEVVSTRFSHSSARAIVVERENSERGDRQEIESKLDASLSKVLPADEFAEVIESSGKINDITANATTILGGLAKVRGSSFESHFLGKDKGLVKECLRQAFKSPGRVAEQVVKRRRGMEEGVATMHLRATFDSSASVIHCISRDLSAAVAEEGLHSQLLTSTLDAVQSFFGQSDSALLLLNRPTVVLETIGLERVGRLFARGVQSKAESTRMDAGSSAASVLGVEGSKAAVRGSLANSTPDRDPEKCPIEPSLIVGRAYSVMIHPDDCKRVCDAFEQVQTGKRTAAAEGVRRLTAKGWMPFTMFVLSISKEKGKTEGMLVIEKLAAHQPGSHNSIGQQLDMIVPPAKKEEEKIAHAVPLYDATDVEIESERAWKKLRQVGKVTSNGKNGVDGGKDRRRAHDSLKDEASRCQEMDRRSLMRMVQKMGHTVEVAENGDDAVTLLAQRKFDLAFMDIQMPKLQGDEAIRKARLMGIEIPIIAVTRMVQDTYHKKQLVEAGATNFTPKPVRPAAVRALLHYHAAPLL
eukprot:CAMPEP_0113915484 /NCGR_PEP_ID=MMETSP0780_2-20120614/31278_1 /TAXON_ID=652834 /ORGANISM="Palpitomonas bilix" /LENGTH=604 /DNA_ID=CAMNT_0000914099 /DNA_START=181 /DNA_END=1995 /DNA_ORIENTATION=- /assembly_acc=CAM_ASM_000599